MRNKPKFFGLAEEGDLVSSLLARADKLAERKPQPAETPKPTNKTPAGRR